MELLDYTTEKGFLSRIKSTTVEAVITSLVDELVAAGEVHDGAGLVAEILRREEEGSTAIGGGLVLPHARFPGVRQVRIAVATLTDPVDLPSEDGQPVDVVILLVGPDGDPRQMLRVLARLARLVKQESFLDGLRAAPDPSALRTAFGRAGTTAG